MARGASGENKPTRAGKTVRTSGTKLEWKPGVELSTAARGVCVCVCLWVRACVRACELRGPRLSFLSHNEDRYPGGKVRAGAPRGPGGMLVRAAGAAENLWLFGKVVTGHEAPRGDWVTAGLPCVTVRCGSKKSKKKKAKKTTRTTRDSSCCF